MVGVSLGDLFMPTNKRCDTSGCETRQVRPMTQERATVCTAVLDSMLTCPHCGHAKREAMPVDACQFFYECEKCNTLQRPAPSAQRQATAVFFAPTGRCHARRFRSSGVAIDAADDRDRRLAHCMRADRGECPQVAETVNSPRLLKAALGR
jgi:hypothetical protein